MTIEFLQFLCVLLLMVVSGSLVMCGWYSITRGKIAFTADGTPYRQGKLLMGWHFFWTRVVKREKVQVQGNSLLLALPVIREMFGGILYPNSHNTCFQAVGNSELYENLHTRDWELEQKHDYIVEHVADDIFRVFRYENQYLWPEWIRKPMSDCVHCYPSVYGSVFYFVSVMLNDGLFQWSSAPGGAFIFYWFVFCISTSALNSVLIKKVL